MPSSRTIQSALLTSTLLLSAGASPTPQKRQTYAPAIQSNFPDPCIMQGGDGVYYAYATAGNGVQIQVANSSDSINWTLLEGLDALQPGSITWAPENPQVWAPDVTPGPDGVYYMYFSAISEASGNGDHCIGFATSTSPLGPFVPNSDEPWVCDAGIGDIDPNQFMDADGTRWVLWKVDGNSIGSDSTPIMIQQVADDGFTQIGDAIEILNRDAADGPLIEAPSLILNNGTYYLTFSSNMYNTALYDTSYATASSVTGPYTKAQAPEAPILTTGLMGLYGPGGADMLIVPNENMVMVWHGWDGSDLAERYMYASSINPDDGEIQIYWG